MSQPLDQVDELESSRMPLLDHLRELRTRVIRASLGLFVGMGISLFAVDELVAILRQPFDEACVTAELAAAQCQLVIVSSLFEGVYTWMWAAFLGGLVIAMPVVAWQIWGFIAPGLYKSERRMVAPLTFSSTVLFATGALFCFYVILPVALPFFFTILPNMATQLSIRGYLGGIITMMLAFGASFQLPVGVWFLARIGLIDHTDMIRGFRYAVVGIFIVAALITPPDPLTQTFLAIPLIVLYIIGIAVAWATTTKVRADG